MVATISIYSVIVNRFSTFSYLRLLVLDETLDSLHLDLDTKRSISDSNIPRDLNGWISKIDCFR